MTKYHVFCTTAELDVFTLVGPGIEAHSADGAIRKYAEKKLTAANGSYVAVPARSWKPVMVAVETQTRIRIGGEA